MHLPSLPLFRRPRGPALPGGVLSTLQMADRPPPRGSRVWRRVTEWLAGDAWTVTAGDPPGRLQPAREAFADALADIDTPYADVLRRRILSSASLDELWHVRPAVFGAVSRQFSQAEAMCRLSQLDDHRPPRAPVSSFATLS
jgi:hypothetical protein